MEIEAIRKAVEARIAGYANNAERFGPLRKWQR
jgi:hypothetical protein